MLLTAERLEKITKAVKLLPTLIKEKETLARRAVSLLHQGDPSVGRGALTN